MALKSNEFVEQYFDETADIIKRVDVADMDRAIEILFEAWKNGKHVFVMGNGGSAGTANHFTSDLLKTTIVEGKKRFKAIGLTDNVPVMTAWINDVGWDHVFQGQLENFIEPGDVLVGFSVHGGSIREDNQYWSQNMPKAYQFAKSKGAKAVGFAGYDGGAMKKICDVCVIVPADSTPHVEGLHVVLSHLIIFRLKQMMAEYKGK
jgi:D-sedoheptulose 7-phosphate isomerase